MIDSKRLQQRRDRKNIRAARNKKVPLDESNIADELMHDLNLFEEEVRNNERYQMNFSSSVGNTVENIIANGIYKDGAVNEQSIDMEYIPHITTPSDLDLKIASSFPISEKWNKNKGRRQRV